MPTAQRKPHGHRRLLTTRSPGRSRSTPPTKIASLRRSRRIPAVRPSGASTSSTSFAGRRRATRTGTATPDLRPQGHQRLHDPPVLEGADHGPRDADPGERRRRTRSIRLRPRRAVVERVLLGFRRVRLGTTGVPLLPSTFIQKKTVGQMLAGFPNIPATVGDKIDRHSVVS